MGDQIIYGTDERSARTAGVFLWREQQAHATTSYASQVDSARPLRAILSSNPPNELVTELFDNARTHHIDQFKPYAHKINVNHVKRNLVAFMNKSHVEQLMYMFPQLVHENDVLHCVMLNSSFMNDTAWSELVKLIKAGANTDYVYPSGRDLNDLARARHCYDKYRAALKKARITSYAAAGSAASAVFAHSAGPAAPL
jgi:hypothetical protein